MFVGASTTVIYNRDFPSESERNRIAGQNTVELNYLLQVVPSNFIHSDLDYLDQKCEKKRGPSPITDNPVISSHNLFQNCREVDWLNLPEHIIFLIAAKLMDVKDNVRLSAAQTWRPVYIEIRECALHESILLIDPPKDKHDFQIRCLYSLAVKKVLNFPVSVPHNIICCGSGHGWLTTFSENYEVCLVNPFLSCNNKIMLHPLTAFERGPNEASVAVDYIQKAVLSANPLVSSNYVVMAIHSDFRRLSFFKPGDKAWSHVGSDSTHFLDLIYHKDKFYAVHQYGAVFVIDVNHPSSKVSKIANWNDLCGMRIYLVESSGEALQIVRNEKGQSNMELNYLLQVVPSNFIHSDLDYLDRKCEKRRGPSPITDNPVISSHNLFQNCREVDWLNLPELIIFLIAAKVMDVKDNVRFGAVCQTWRTVYIELRECALREPILLMVPPKDKHDVQIRCLYSLTAKEVLNFPVPVPHNIVCCGSSHGWLTTVRENYEVCLVNPFLSCNNKIMLPPLTAFERGPNEASIAVDYIRKAVLSANPLVSSNYVVMAIHSDFGRLSFFKPGDKAWSHVGLDHTLFLDLIYHKDKFYAVHQYGAVFVIDVNLPSPKVSQIGNWNDLCGVRIYLVESSGEVLQIVRNFRDSALFYFTVGFTVWKLAPEEQYWIEVKILAGRIVFLGDNTSVSLSVSDLPGCKPNCIYFTNDCFQDYYGMEEVGPHDMGIYNLEDGSIEALYPIESKMIVPGPIWVQPMM